MPQPRDTFPNAFEAAFLVACLFAAEFLIGAAFYDAKAVLGIEPDELMSVVVVLANGLVLTAVMQWAGLGYAAVFHESRSSPSAVVGLLALPIFCVVPALALGNIALGTLVVALFPMSAADAAMFERMAAGGWISTLTACLIAPLVEEMLFRGIILRSFLRQYERWPAILGSALLFGLSHMNIYQCVAASVVGLVIGWLYERTRSLWPGILLHAAYNTTLSLDLNTDALSPTQWGIALAGVTLGSVTLRRLLLPRRT
ncbi:lysostaphin resistance A-like protein [Roseateles sp. NT4]|uniref:CPBP family intramembrane glutamic endopeptidase n=1 Tax=Roseateles sp. NT4 TaxID=3453715 RepID=UPI003EEF4DB1